MRTPLIALALLPLTVACGDDGVMTRVADTRADAAIADAADIADTADTATPAPPPPRLPGERAPRSARCDDADTTRCLLPWPSNVFTAPDATSATGVRVAVHPGEIPDDDQVTQLNRADGFSRVTPLLTVFPGALDTDTLPDGVAVLIAEGDDVGERVPLRFATFEVPGDPVLTLVVALPARPLRPATEHLVVILDALRNTAGVAPAPDAHIATTLADAQPADPDAAARHAYHAPGRAALTAAAIDRTRVLRMWDFTTRSRLDPQRDLRAMRQAALDALGDGAVSVEVTAVASHADPAVALVVSGHLSGVPSFLTVDGQLSRDAAGAVMATGTTQAPFRAVLPVGTGDYPVVVYGHGTGGDVSDGSFDALMASHGALKLNLQFDGWTQASLPQTITGLLTPLRGTDQATARILQSLTGASALLAALDGPLGDVLAAPTLGGAANPVAGRRPDTAQPVWAGGSLGGVMGLVFSHLEFAIAGGVLNVPGAGFTHWLPQSTIYDILELGFADRYDDAIDLNVAAAMTQGLWDPMDGAAWVDERALTRPFLVQISVGDPVLPNVGSDLVATSLGATHIGAPLYPIAGLETATEVLGGSAVTQFLVPSSDSNLDVHGFAARNTPAGAAARQQFIDFVTSLWDGAPRIAAPDACVANTPANSCDFSSGAP